MFRGIPHPIEIPLQRRAWKCKSAALQLSPSVLEDPCELCSACTEGISEGKEQVLRVAFIIIFPPVCNEDHAELPSGLERVMESSGQVPKSALLS